MAKSRVKPSKPVTVSSLQLSAALFSITIRKSSGMGRSLKYSGTTAWLYEVMCPMVKDDSTHLLRIGFRAFVISPSQNSGEGWKLKKTL